MSTGGMTVGQWLCHGAALLRKAGIDDPRREARLLLGHALGLDAAVLLLDRDRIVNPPGLDALLQRRALREPMAAILGQQGFWTLDLRVSPATLIPRADSETLIRAAIIAHPDRRAVRRVLDLGTGTGCLLLAALCEFPSAWGVGVDLQPDAAALARSNAAFSGLAERACFVSGHWADSLAGVFDLVLCNPPYIPTGDLDGLMPDVRLYEPASALDGGADGLAAYRAILADLPRLLAPGGRAILEMGYDQSEVLPVLADASGFQAEATHTDWGGIDRALVLRAKGNRSG